LTALNHHLDLNWLHEAYRRVRKDAAPGVDGQTVAEYGEHLTENLKDLLARAKSGRHVAPPVKRACPAVELRSVSWRSPATSIPRRCRGR